MRSSLIFLPRKALLFSFVLSAEYKSTNFIFAASALTLFKFLDQSHIVDFCFCLIIIASLFIISFLSARDILRGTKTVSFLDPFSVVIPVYPFLARFPPVYIKIGTHIGRGRAHVREIRMRGRGGVWGVGTTGMQTMKIHVRLRETRIVKSFKPGF